MSRDARERRKGDAPTDATRSENDRRRRRMSRSTRRRRFLTFIGEHAQLHAGRDGGRGRSVSCDVSPGTSSAISSEKTPVKVVRVRPHMEAAAVGVLRDSSVEEVVKTHVPFHCFTATFVPSYLVACSTDGPRKVAYQRLGNPLAPSPRAPPTPRDSFPRWRRASSAASMRGDLRDPGPRVGFRTGGPRGDCRARGARASDVAPRRGRARRRRVRRGRRRRRRHREGCHRASRALV